MNAQSAPATRRLNLDAPESFYELSHAIPDSVKRSARACIDAQRSAVPEASRVARSGDAAAEAVSEEALDAILAGGDDVHGIATDGSISDVVVINAPHIADSIHDAGVAKLRDELDRQVGTMMRGLLRRSARIVVRRSGHFWYPPGSYMGWHTNNRAPGWRAYLTCAEEPGRSFFRYRSPAGGEIVTSMDDTWDLRVFRVDPENPLWHAVYSDTDRFSFGYAIIEQPLSRIALRRIKGLIGR